MTNYSVTTIDLLRHGKPEGGDIFRGTTDVPLSAKGWQQMHAAVENLDGWQQVVTSPLQRCQVFSQHFAQRNQIGVATVEQLSEMSFGDWDGLTYKAVETADKDAFHGFWRDPITNTPPNGEPMMAFCQRIRQAFWQQVEEYTGQHVMMVVHGGVIRAILQDVLNADNTALMRFEVPYASISRIKIYHDDKGMFPQLAFHNR